MATQIRGIPASTGTVLLRIVSWLFKLGGLLFALMAVFMTVGNAMGMTPPAGYTSYRFPVLLLAAFAIALFGIGVLLARHSRVGGVLALAINLYPTMFILAGQRPFAWTDAVVAIVTVVVIASIWPQLTSWSLRPRQAT